nr:hypothetical protein BaRGS_005910 [Batillaria attramentaria]
MEQRAQLVGEVTTVLSEVQQLEHEIHRVSKDVQKAEREYQQETESLRDLGRKTCLLNVYRAKCRENTAQCNAYSDQIDEKTTTYSKRIMDAALHLRPDDPSTSLGTLLETSAEECQMKHVMRFVETEKHRNEAHTNIQALEATRTKIIAALKRYFSSIQHGNLGLAVSLVQAKLDLTADTTAKECYRQEAESLKEKVAEGHTDRQTLLTIHRKIQDFTDLAVG